MAVSGAVAVSHRVHNKTCMLQGLAWLEQPQLRLLLEDRMRRVAVCDQLNHLLGSLYSHFEVLQVPNFLQRQVQRMRCAVQCEDVWVPASPIGLAMSPSRFQ